MKYKEQINECIKELIFKYFNILNDDIDAYEAGYRDLLIEQEKIEQKIDSTFDKLFEPLSIERYVKTINELCELIRNNFNIYNDCHKNNLVRYPFEEQVMRIKHLIQCDFDNFNSDKRLEYKLNPPIESLTETDETNLRYLNEDKWEAVANLVIEKLTLFEKIVNLYQVFGMSQLNFKPGIFNKLANAISPIRDSSSYVVDFSKILNILSTTETGDIDDPLADDYIDYCDTVLEAAYLVLNTPIKQYTNIINETLISPQAIMTAISNINDNCEFYVDELIDNGLINLRIFYQSIYNFVNEIESSQIIERIKG